MTPQELKDIIDKSGIYFTEAAELFHVTRATLYRWLRGVKPKQQFMYHSACEMALILKLATEANYLPIHVFTGKLDRRKALSEAIQKAEDLLITG